MDGQIDGGHFTIRRGTLNLNAAFGDLEGVEIEAASGPMTIAAGGNLLNLVYASSSHPIVITGGAGRITGSMDVGGEFDVRFDDLALCMAWDLSGLAQAGGEPARTNCQ